jgi:hypothetical protein
MRARFVPLAFLCGLAAGSLLAQGFGGRGGPPLSGKPGAVIDLTGTWVSIIDEDWRWRMVTPPKGDFASVPLNAAGRKAGDDWDPARDEREDNQCRAYGAAGVMRLPTRLRIDWQDDQTLKIETDAGEQIRLLHFGVWKSPGGEATWQGDSLAAWMKQPLSRGFAPPLGGPRPGGGGALRVITTHMKPGYLRKNGAPYSAGAVLTEYLDRVEFEGMSYLILTSIVEDPQYLNDTFITSEQFRLEPDNSKWRPKPCKAD